MAGLPPTKAWVLAGPPLLARVVLRMLIKAVGASSTASMRWRSREAVSVLVDHKGSRITLMSAKVTSAGFFLPISGKAYAPRVFSHCCACLALRQPARLDSISARAQDSKVIGALHSSFLVRIN